MTTTYIGRAQNRIDGPAKVTGEAKYAAEYDAPGLAHGWVVGSAIARGRITRIDAQHALAVPGVLRVFTHENRPEVASYDRSDKKDVGVPGSRSRPLYDERIHYSGQPIALVVAERLETARYAASLVRVDYEQERHVTDLHEERDAAYDPKDEDGSASAKDRGDAEGAFAQASVRHEAEYTHPFEHHNPMEMHASTVVWHDDGKLTVYEKTQGAPRTQKYLTRVFGLSKEDVRVVCSYVGGAFGSGLRAQYQLFLAVLAARELKRPVRVALTRQQMFTIGYRPDTIQRVALGANEDGTLQSIRHDAIGNTSRIEDFTENDVSWSAALYKCENIKRSYKVAKLDLFTPIDMRAPGGATGVYAIECAIDELAYKLGIDPLELRLKNDADRDYNDDRPFSSRALRECFRQGAEKFGWSKRNPTPRSMREGNELIGWGMATGIWEAMRLKASARVVLSRRSRSARASA